jgi:hypothetical protein
MARPLRIEFADALYHVTWGDRREAFHTVLKSNFTSTSSFICCCCRSNNNALFKINPRVTPLQPISKLGNVFRMTPSNRVHLPLVVSSLC